MKEAADQRSIERELTPLHQAYAQHLQNYDWDFFSTVTFKRLHRDPINAAAKVSRALDKLGCTRAFLAVERHRLDGVHVHTLHRHIFRPELRSSSIWKYFDKAFGFSTVSLPRAADTVAVYCAKYVTKSGDESGDTYYYYGDADAWNLDKWEVPLIT